MNVLFSATRKLTSTSWCFYDNKTFRLQGHTSVTGTWTIEHGLVMTLEDYRQTPGIAHSEIQKAYCKYIADLVVT